MLILPAVSLANTPVQSWEFDVYLDDKRIGDHRFILSDQNKDKSVLISANFEVKFLFFSAYQYQHDNIEKWSNDCVNTITSFTNDNGEIINLSARRIDNEMVININDKTLTENNQCIKTFAYWDPSILQERKLLNAQTGEYMSVDIENVGSEKFTLNNGDFETSRYQIKTTEFTIDLWYSKNGRWVGLNSTTKDGHLLEYRLK